MTYGNVLLHKTQLRSVHILFAKYFGIMSVLLVARKHPEAKEEKFNSNGMPEFMRFLAYNFLEST